MVLGFSELHLEKDHYLPAWLLADLQVVFRLHGFTRREDFEANGNHLC